VAFELTHLFTGLLITFEAKDLIMLADSLLWHTNSATLIKEKN